MTEAGAVFGELSALLDAPHSADVRALEKSEFHVADAATLLRDPTALLYVTMVLARRIDAANHGLLQLKIMLEAGEPRGLIDRTLDGIGGLLSASAPATPRRGRRCRLSAPVNQQGGQSEACPRTTWSRFN